MRDSIGSHSEFLPRALNSKFPSLEAYICFWVGDTTFLITYLESWFKDDSVYIPEFSIYLEDLRDLISPRRVYIFNENTNKFFRYFYLMSLKKDETGLRIL